MTISTISSDKNDESDVIYKEVQYVVSPPDIRDHKIFWKIWCRWQLGVRKYDVYITYNTENIPDDVTKEAREIVDQIRANADKITSILQTQTSSDCRYSEGIIESLKAWAKEKTKYNAAAAIKDLQIKISPVKGIRDL